MLRIEDFLELGRVYQDELAAPVAEFSLGGKLFSSNTQTHLMGVVNLSADSWYRESVVLTADAAIQRGRVLHEQGASLIDIGAESSLVQAARVSGAVQNSVLVPVVRELSKAGILVSVETYHPEVTQACLEAGAKVLNLTGSEQNEEMFRRVADHEAGLILCFVQGANVREVGDLELGRDPVGALYDYFARKTELAMSCGVKRMWIDPGLGFYYRNLQDSDARVRHQMNVFLNTFRLRKLGWPTCQALPHAFTCFEEEVRVAEAFFGVLALLGKTDLLRTHEVVKVRGVLRAMELFRASAAENRRDGTQKNK
jgi:dihydropteroate synthase